MKLKKNNLYFFFPIVMDQIKLIFKVIYTYLEKNKEEEEKNKEKG